VPYKVSIALPASLATVHLLTWIGVLVETDASIHAIIVRIDQEYRNDFIIEDIDDENLLIKRERYEDLKRLLHEVRDSCF
jgi:TFIIH basal transcription factor complex TTD-A subunit